MRNPVSRELFRLTGTDWHSAAVFWREIIVGGIVRAAAGEEIDRHKGRRVLLEASTLDVWLKKRIQRKLRCGPAQSGGPSPKTSGAKKPRRNLAYRGAPSTGCGRLCFKARERNGASPEPLRN